MKKTDNICKIGGCKDKVLARGLCRPHYYMAVRAIDNKRIKGWEELEAMGISEGAISGRNKEKREQFENALGKSN